MTTFYVTQEQINNGFITITGEDLHHIKDVLRLKTGESIDICDSAGTRYKTKLSSYDKDLAKFEIVSKENYSTELSVDITLYQGLPKGDKMELIIQKCTELGVNNIYPVNMEHCIVKYDSKNMENKLNRWNKIAKESSTQSGRQKLLSVEHSINLQNIIENIPKYDIVLLLYENEQECSLKQAIKLFKEKNVDIKKIAIIVGPEGGLSSEEVNKLSSFENVYLCTLGKRILRTETAGMAAVSMLIYEFDM